MATDEQQAAHQRPSRGRSAARSRVGPRAVAQGRHGRLEPVAGSRPATVPVLRAGGSSTSRRARATIRRPRAGPPAARVPRAPAARRIAATVGWTVGGTAARRRAGRRFFVPPAVRDHLAGLGDAARQSGDHDRAARRRTARGNVLFLTVRVTNARPDRLAVPRRGSIDPDQRRRRSANVRRRAACPTRTTPRQQRGLMQQSQDDAKNVALERLGYTVDARAPQR